MQDHLANSSGQQAEHTGGLPTGQPSGQPADIDSLISSAMGLANAMQAKLLNPDGSMKKEVPLREGKEAVASISTLLSMILRNKQVLEKRQYQQAFDAAVLEVLEEMDEEQNTRFFDRLQEKISHLGGTF
jgi:hypothetical protein